MAGQHLTFGIDPILPFRSYCASALFVEFICAKANLRFEIGNRSVAAVTVAGLGHVQNFVFFVGGFGGPRALCSSHLLNSLIFVEWCISHTLTQQPSGCTSFVAGYVVMINRSGCGRDKNRVLKISFV